MATHPDGAIRTRGRRLLDWFIGQRPREHPAAAIRAMVVDDDAVIRALIVVALRIEGFDVCEAADGRAALDLVAAARPDIAIIDATMPDISGCDLALRLHADPAAAGMKVLLLTGHHGGGEPPGPLNVDAMLGKPFDPDELIEVVTHLAH
jgi:DNA-binding response OmpR family regulator